MKKTHHFLLLFVICCSGCYTGKFDCTGRVMMLHPAQQQLQVTLRQHSNTTWYKRSAFPGGLDCAKLKAIPRETWYKSYRTLFRDGYILIQDNSLFVKDTSIAIIDSIAVSKDRLHATVFLTLIKDGKTALLSVSKKDTMEASFGVYGGSLKVGELKIYAQ